MNRFFVLAALTLAMAAPSSFAADSKVADSADTIQPALIGATAPKAAVKTLDGNSTDLHELLLGKKSVVIFYRGGW